MIIIYNLSTIGYRNLKIDGYRRILNVIKLKLKYTCCQSTGIEEMPEG